MTKSSKVMDVSKPGSTAPDASGKPVIVGHRPMVADPMVSQDDEKDETIEVKKVGPKPAAQTGKKIEPLSADMKPEEANPGAQEPAKPTEPKAKDEQPKVEAKTEEVPAPVEPGPESDKPADEPVDDKAKADAAGKEQEAEAERQAKIQEVIDSKKYFVKIDDSKSAPVKTFVLTVLVILLVGAAVLTVLVDAEILDLGIGLPFDFIK